MVYPFNEMLLNNKKGNKLLIHTTICMNPKNHYYQWNKRDWKIVYTTWFHLYKMLAITNQSTVTESRFCLLAWEWEERQEGRSKRGIWKLLDFMDIFVLIAVTVCFMGYNISKLIKWYTSCRCLFHVIYISIKMLKIYKI